MKPLFPTAGAALWFFAAVLISTHVSKSLTIDINHQSAERDAFHGRFTPGDRVTVFLEPAEFENYFRIIDGRLVAIDEVHMVLECAGNKLWLLRDDVVNIEPAGVAFEPVSNLQPSGYN